MCVMVVLKVFCCVLVEIYLAQCTIFKCPGGVQVNGNSIIFPGEVGIFRCTTLNSVQLNWDVGGETLVFRNSDDRVEQNGPTTTAYLVERNLDSDGIVGNSTSVLLYTPDPNTRGFVSISCDGGLVDTFCSRNVRVIGTVTTPSPTTSTTECPTEEAREETTECPTEEAREETTECPTEEAREETTECPTEEAREEGARGGLLAWTGVSVVLIMVLSVACVAMFFWVLYLRQVIKHHVQEHHLQLQEQQRRSKSPTPVPPPQYVETKQPEKS